MGMKLAAPAIFWSLVLEDQVLSFAQSVASDTPVIDEPIIRTFTTNVVAPVLVTDRRGQIIDGLQPAQFHLLDNGKEQNIQVDVSFQTLSIVVVIETSARVDAILQQVKHLGTLMGPVMLGSQGQSEAAVLGFDSAAHHTAGFH